MIPDIMESEKSSITIKDKYQSSEVQSRMSNMNKESVDRVVSTDEPLKEEESPAIDFNGSMWEENMVHDQSAGEWVQLLLRTELNKVGFGSKNIIIICL